MPRFYMEFERPLAQLHEKVEELRRLDLKDDPDLVAEIEALDAEIERLQIELYLHLGPWEKVQVARHPERPKTDDYVEALFTDVVELRGDRLYGDDAAMYAGLARLGGRKVAVLGHRKGGSTKENLERNFGMPQPDGFRKAERLMRLAEKASLPLVTFIDTPGAYPGLEAEERGQAWAIAAAIARLSALRVPVVSVVIGEGGSGGALAIGFGDRLMMLQNAYYSVSSPEACASIIYKDVKRARDCAESLWLTADLLTELGICDEIVPEPVGGAHRDRTFVFDGVRRALTAALDSMAATPPDELVQARYARIRGIGAYGE